MLCVPTVSVDVVQLAVRELPAPASGLTAQLLMFATPSVKACPVWGIARHVAVKMTSRHWLPDWLN